MLGALLIAAGAVLMALGVAVLLAWTGGRSTWFDSGVFDRRGSTFSDRQLLTLYFTALVVAPLLIGGLLIILGLRELI